MCCMMLWSVLPLMSRGCSRLPFSLELIISVCLHALSDSLGSQTSCKPHGLRCAPPSSRVRLCRNCFRREQVNAPALLSVYNVNRDKKVSYKCSPEVCILMLCGCGGSSKKVTWGFFLFFFWDVFKDDAASLWISIGWHLYWLVVS